MVITNTVRTAVQDPGDTRCGALDRDGSTLRLLPRALGTGMTFVIIEPGIYIREAALDSLPKAPENAAFIDKVRPAVQNFLLRANTYLSGSPAARLAFRSASSASSTSLRAASCSCASFAFLNTSIALRTAHCSAIDVAATVMPSAFEKAA